MLVTCSRGVVAGDQQPLELGIVPYLSTRPILTLYELLQHDLQVSLKRPVLLVRAPNPEAFVRHALKRESPVAITAPLYARLAQLEAGYHLGPVQ